MTHKIGIMFIFLALFVVSFAVCQVIIHSVKRPEVVQPTIRTDIDPPSQVSVPELAFEYKGCKVYRFIDHWTGHTEYYADCRGPTN